MSMHKACLIGLVLLFGGQAHGKDWRWELTSRMEMPGMPQVAGMGARKHTVCVAEGKEQEPDREHQKDCKIVDRSVSGKITRMTMQCKQGTARMEHEQISAEHWRSKMEMTGGGKGENMTVMTEARRLAACDAAKENTMPRSGR